MPHLGLGLGHHADEPSHYIEQNLPKNVGLENNEHRSPLQQSLQLLSKSCVLWVPTTKMTQSGIMDPCPIYVMLNAESLVCAVSVTINTDPLLQLLSKSGVWINNNVTEWIDGSMAHLSHADSHDYYIV